MKLIDPILVEIEQEGQTTKRVLDRIPDEKLTWKPHSRSFSLGQLGLHIASLPGNLAAMATQDAMEVPNFSQTEGKSRKEIVDVYSAGLQSAKETLSKMDDDRLMGSWSLTKNGAVILAMPRASLIRSIMLNHAYHHRGQLSVYLRMLDVPVPSIYGPSADENPFG